MLRSIRLQLTFWYIGSISLLVVVFGGIAFFSLQAFLIQHLDQALYNGAKIIEESLSDYTLEDEDDPQSLHETGEEDALFADRIDEEVNESFVGAFEREYLKNPNLFKKSYRFTVENINNENDIQNVSNFWASLVISIVKTWNPVAFFVWNGRCFI